MIEAVVKEPLRKIASSVDRAIKLVTEVRRENKCANEVTEKKIE